MAGTVSYIVPTHDRKADLREAVQSILDQDYPDKEVVVVSDSTDGTAELFTEGGPFDREEVTFHRADLDLGPAGARNVGVDLASGTVYVFLDDDAAFVEPSATHAVVDAFDADPELGALAFCIRDHATGELNSAEFPHRDRTPSREERFRTTYFVGAGCAVRSSALEAAGPFPEHFERFEEVDLAFRIIDAGYEIEFFPAVLVEHKNAPVDQRPPNRVLRYDLENRMMAAVRNLYWRHVVVSLVVWTGYTLYRAGFDPRPLAVGLASFLGKLPRLLREREVVDARTLEYLSENGGRLYY